MAQFRPLAGLDSVWPARGVAAFGAVWLAVYAGRPDLPSWVAWVPPLFCAGHAVVATRSAGYAADIPAPARRFWRRMCLVTLLILLGTVSQIWDSLAPAGPPVQRSGPITMVLYLAGVALVLRALLVLPVARRTRTEWFTFALDAGSVAVAAVLFTQYFSFRYANGVTSVTGNAASGLGLVAMAFVAMLVILKVSLAGWGSLDRRALATLAWAGLLGGLAGAATGLFAGRPWLNDAQLAIPLAMMLVAQAAHFQRRSPSTPVVHRPRRRRRYSVLPYAAIAASDGLLLVVLRGDHQAAVLAVGVVLLTTLVVVRQIAALRENDGLLNQVDDTVRELQASEDRLLHQATHDTLTDLANRALFHQRVEAVVTGPNPHRVAAILVDLDDFKAINDRLGHDVGDALLVTVAGRLTGCVPPTDLVARLGGDEFVVLLQDTTEHEAGQTAERILTALSVPVTAAGYDLLVNASIGLTMGAPELTGADLLRRADVAMYTAKERGKDGWAAYDAELDSLAYEHAQLGAAMRLGMDRGEFQLRYQPVVTLPDGRLHGVEALIRWQHPVRGLVSPNEFIPVAERSGLIVPLGRWILREACLQAVSWQRRFGGAAPKRVNVNVSARQLREPGFVGEVADILTETGLHPSVLVIEVTETAVFDGGPAAAALDGIAMLGVGIALDDFGTGHSSLGLLRTCPVDVLKVDKSFVDGVLGDSEESVIVRFMIQVANGLRLATVAEGVESAAQAARLHALGYQLAQGYHFARPLPAAELDLLLMATPAEPEETLVSFR